MNRDKALEILQKTTEDYKKISKEFIETRKKPWSSFFGFKKYIGNDDKILDVGCGPGRLIEIFKDTDVEYVGFDISEEEIAFAERTFLGRSHPFKGATLKISPKFFVWDIVNIPWPFENESFNVVFMVAVFHHIPSEALRQETLAEARRVLKPGGKLIMTNWNLRSAWAIKKFWPEILRTIFPHKNLDRGDFFAPWKLKRKKIPLYFPLFQRGIKEDLGRGEIVFRFYHSFSLREIEKEIKRSGLTVLENYYTINGEKTNFLLGKNILTIAEKERHFG